MAGISGEALISIEWLLIGIAFCLILGRLNLRLYLLSQELILSDYFIIAAFLAGIALNACDIVLYNKGVYQPDIDFDMTQWVASEEEQVQVYKLFYINYFPFYTEQYLNKASILALYYEIFPRDSRKLMTGLRFLTIYCAISFIVTIAMVLFSCRWGCFWDLYEPCPEQCERVNDNLGWALHFTNDLGILFLPIIYIYRTNMSTTQKISAGVTFSIGIINIGVTIARWFVVQAVFTFTPIPFLTTGEALAIADGHSGLIVAILLSLRPYLRIWQGADLTSRPREMIKISETDSKQEACSTRHMSNAMSSN